MIEQLRADRDNIDLWEVYADHLQDAGDPVGELVALSVQLDRAPRGATAAAIRAWLEARFPDGVVVSEEALEFSQHPRRRHQTCQVQLAMGHFVEVRVSTGYRAENDTQAWWQATAERVVTSPLHALADRFWAFGSHNLRLGLDPFMAHELPYRQMHIEGTAWVLLPSWEVMLERRPHLRRLVVTGIPEASPQLLAHDGLTFLAWTPTPDAEGPYDRQDVERVLMELESGRFPALETVSVSHLDDDQVARLRARFGDRLKTHDGSLP